MPYHVKTPSVIVGDVYYKGNNSWTENYDDRKIYEYEWEAQNVISQSVVKNNITYTANHFANATIVSE